MRILTPVSCSVFNSLIPTFHQFSEKSQSHAKTTDSTTTNGVNAVCCILCPLPKYRMYLFYSIPIHL